MINQHWDKVKLCLPFGDIEEKIPKWAPTKVINIEDLMDARTELPERAHTSFEIQPPTNTTINDDLNYRYDTFGRASRKFKDMSKIELVNKIFENETPISAQLNKGNLHLMTLYSGQEKYINVYQKNKQGHFHEHKIHEKERIAANPR